MKILIVYYSLYGHVFKLAQAVKEGVESVKGAEVLFRRVEEFDIVLKKTADDKYLEQMREQQKDIPVCTLDDLRAADGVLIGPRRRARWKVNRQASLLALLPTMVARKLLLLR